MAYVKDAYGYPKWAVVSDRSMTNVVIVENRKEEGRLEYYGADIYVNFGDAKVAALRILRADVADFRSQINYVKDLSAKDLIEN